MKCTADITGVWTPGIFRRPQWLHGGLAERVIAWNLHKAREKSDSIGGIRRSSEFQTDGLLFGKGYSTNVPQFGIDPLWRPCVIVQYHLQLANMVLAKNTAVAIAKCFFGCDARSIRKQDTFSLLERC